MEKISSGDLSFSCVRFVKESSVGFLNSIDFSKIRAEGKVASLFFEIEDCYVDALQNLLSKHGDRVVYLMYHHVINGHIPDQDLDITLGSFRSEVNEFAEIFHDSVFSAERIIESADGEVVIFSDFSDYTLVVLSEEDFDTVFVPPIPTPLISLRAAMDGAGPSEEQIHILRNFLASNEDVLR